MLRRARALRKWLVHVQRTQSGEVSVNVLAARTDARSAEASASICTYIHLKWQGILRTSIAQSLLDPLQSRVRSNHTWMRRRVKILGAKVLRGYEPRIII